MGDGYCEQDRLFLYYPNQYVAFEFPLNFHFGGISFSVPVKATTQVPMQGPHYSNEELISSITISNLHGIMEDR